MSDHGKEIASGARFAFGKNWKRFLRRLNEERISMAEESLRHKLHMKDLVGKDFLDVGCGSGLFSLAARRLGARVHSFDYDPQSVACTLELRHRYFSDDSAWKVEEASVMDDNYLESLGKFDIVYAWGILHHTGAMWQALEKVQLLVKLGGKLFISIYNDQGWPSCFWTGVKKTYNIVPGVFKPVVVSLAFIRIWGFTMLKDLLRTSPLRTWRNYSGERGMSPWEDLVDWVGGYPFEVAKPEKVCDFYRDRGFKLVTLKTCGGGRGCNEFVFEKIAGSNK